MTKGKRGGAAENYPTSDTTVTTLGGAEKVLTPAERWRGLSNSWRPLDSGLGGRRRAPTMRNRVVRDPKLQRGRELGVSQPEGRDNS